MTEAELDNILNNPQPSTVRQRQALYRLGFSRSFVKHHCATVETASRVINGALTLHGDIRQPSNLITAGTVAPPPFDAGTPRPEPAATVAATMPRQPHRNASDALGGLGDVHTLPKACRA